MPLILVIESNKFQRRSLCRLIHAAGADRVTEALDVEDARRVLARNPETACIVVADPDLLGSAAFSDLKGLAEIGSLAGVLLLSHRRTDALPELRERSEIEGLNCIAVLRKPVSAEEIGSVLGQTKDLQAPRSPRVSPQPLVSQEDLSECLRAGRVRTRFQPKVELGSGRLVGCEASSYVNHTKHGALPMASLGHAVAQLGAQRVMTAGLLRDAAKLIRSMREMGLASTVSVTLGADVLSEPGDATSLDAYVRTLGVSPSDIAFEINEAEQATPSSALEENLARLRMRGYCLSVDATSADASARTWPYTQFSEIKLHAPNEHTSRNGARSVLAVSSFISLARKHGVTTCAVGIRSQADLDASLRAGFELGQGELFAPSMPAEDILTWIEREERAGRLATHTPAREEVG